MLPILLFLVAAMQRTPFVPAHFDRQAEEAAFRKTVEIAELDATVSSERVVRVPPPPVELWRVVVEGRGDVDDAAFLLNLVRIRESRLIELESLHADGERFTARFLLPVFDFDTAATPEATLDLARARSEAVAPLRERRRLLDAHAMFEALPDHDPQLRLTAAEIGDTGEMRLRGVALGAAARADVLARLRAADFAVPRMELAPSGACRPFAIIVTRGTAETTFATDKYLRSPLCGDPAPRAAQRITARGTNGPLTMQLRDIELPAFFQILNELTGEDFVVDADVKGSSFNIDLDKATLAEALTAIPGVVIGPRPLRQVGRKLKPPLTQNYDGEPISMLLTDANLPSVLCLMQDITGLSMRIAPETKGSVTIFARDVPWDRIVDGMLASADLTYEIEDIDVIVGPREGAIAACEVAKQARSRFTNGPLTLEQLARSDVDVAGVVQHDGKWKAYLGASRTRLWLVEEGQKLFDTRIKSIASTGVVFE